MLKIIYGRNRIKKTEYLYSLIEKKLKKGEKVILLVPEQTVLESEKALCEASIYSLDLRVLSFRRLCNVIFRQYGGLCYNYISKAGKYAVIWKALKMLSPMLKKYDTQLLSDRQLPFMLLDAIEEFRMYGVSPDALMSASSRIEEDPSFSETLYDISQIYALYCDTVHEKYDDPSDDLTAAEMKLQNNRFFEDTNVFIDGFSGFTKQELDLLYHVFAQSKESTVTLGYEKQSNAEAFERLRDTDRALRKAADKGHVSVLDESFDLPLVSKEMDFLAMELWNFSQNCFEGRTHDICAIRCKDKREEVRALALEIKQRVINGGKRYRDFTVVAGNIDDYRGIIEQAFDKYEIPCFISKRTEMKAKSQVRLILSALMIKVYGWQTEHVVSYIRSGLTCLDTKEADMLCEYAQMWKIRGKRWYDENEWRMNPKGFGYEYDEEAYESLGVLNKLRRAISEPLEELFEVFDGQSNVRKVSEALFNYLEKLEIRRKISESAARKREQGRNAEADEDAQLWNCIVSTLDTLVNIASDTEVSAAEYAQLLSLMFENTDIGKIPPGVDEVHLTSANLYRSAGGECVFILGANEKIFPAFPEDRGILGSKEREELALLGIELDKGGERAVYDELLHFYNALTSSEKQACVIYNDSDRPSFALKTLKEIFPVLNEKDMSKLEDIDKVYSPMSAFEYAVSCKDPIISNKIIDLAIKKDGKFVKIKNALNIPIRWGECNVGHDVTDKMSEGGLILSQSKAQKYVECPFAYFCMYVAKMRPTGSGDIENRDIGNYVHRVLEMFFEKAANKNIFELSETECQMMIKEVVNKYKSSIIKEDTDKRTECLFERLESLSSLLIKNLVKEFSLSKFRPILFEYPIGVFGGILSIPISLEDGTRVHMNGFIDRVDIYRQGTELYLRVIDYKTGKKEFSLEDISKGLNLQLLIYLFTVCSSKDSDFLKRLGADSDCNLHPAGALYFLAGMPSISKNSLEFSEEELTEEVMKNIKRNGILTDDIKILSAMEPGLCGLYIPVKLGKNNELDLGRGDKYPIASEKKFQEIKENVISKIKEIGEGMKKGIANADPVSEQEACKYCDFKEVCRRDMKEDS